MASHSFQLSTGQKRSAVEATAIVLELAAYCKELGAPFPADAIKSARAYLLKVYLEICRDARQLFCKVIMVPLADL